MILNEDLLNFEFPILLNISHGERIRILRKNLKLTQQSFAKKLGVTKLTVARWELGKRKCKGSSFILMSLLTKFDLWKL
jgi:DNA-binding transcriptional regulator YiaG